MNAAEHNEENNIFKYIKENNLPMVQKLLIENPNLADAVDKNGLPLPFCAALTGELKLVSYIVEYSRASMNMTDQLGRTILHYAAETNAREVAKYLVELVGMDPLKGDYNLITPFELAHQSEYSQVEDYFAEMIGCNYEEMYHNPIRTGFYADPSIVRVGKDYYMVNSSFTYFPCIPISHSRDLLHWDIIGYAITEPEYAGLDGLESGRGYWAPDISYYEERFYITATYRRNDSDYPYRSQIIVSSKFPAGPYSKPVMIEEDGIDPSLFTDEDGSRYMLLNRGARILPLNKEATEQIGEAKLIWYGSNKRAPEGPHLIKKDGYYYLFLAEGGTGMGHQISVARSKTLMGPYEDCPYNPIMRQKDITAVIQRAGHGKPVQTESGDWYMVYLCGRPIDGKYSLLGRETALDPIQWTADGWPIVNCLKGPSVLQKKPQIGVNQYDQNSEIVNSGIKQEKTECMEIPNLNWMWARIPAEHAFEKRTDGVFRLYGGKAEPNAGEGSHVLVRRQTNFVFTVATELSFHCTKEGQEIGVICYYDENTYLTFGIRSQMGSCFLQVTEQIGEKRILSYSKEVNQTDLELSIETDYLKRTFYCKTLEGEKEQLTTLDSVNYLCDEGYHIGKRFTGAMIGIYGVSGDWEDRAYGDFLSFELLNFN